jgi:hypothetical protein
MRTHTRVAEVPATETGRVGGGAMQTTVAVFGVLLGIAGVEHGIGELLQGPARPDGLAFESWPDSSAFEMVGGEPAMTLVSNLLVTGILAIVVGLAVAVWSVRFATSRHGGVVLIGLPVPLLLVGGGFAPPLMGVFVGIGAMRIGVPARRPPSAALRTLGRAWAWFVAAGVLGYLGLVPGTLVLSALTSMQGDNLVLGLALLSFTAFFLSLAAARAHDRAVGVTCEH